MRQFIAIFIGRLIGYLSRVCNFGAGRTWMGLVARTIDPSITAVLSQQLHHRIVVLGTNGKTTTAAMIAHILSASGLSVVNNTTGANLHNGITGTLVEYAPDLLKQNCVGVFEVDEAAFSELLPIIRPTIIVMLNLFRDQLDRYGELDTIASNWKKELKMYDNTFQLILNADDPLIASIGDARAECVSYFGLQQSSKIGTVPDLSADSTYCVSCGTQLQYHWISYAHFGDWYCSSCNRRRPNPVKIEGIINPLEGVYNDYNVQAAAQVCLLLDIPKKTIISSFQTFTPVFGRQETIRYAGKAVQLFLAKNPTGMNENIRTIIAQNQHPIVIIALNDQYVDGTDISWIWDVNFERLIANAHYVICTGERVFDLGVRCKYAKNHQSVVQQWNNVIIEPNLEKAIDIGVKKTSKDKTLYILPTYSAMLATRKILTGRKI